jgi:hypothetical protein
MAVGAAAAGVAVGAKALAGVIGKVIAKGAAKAAAKKIAAKAAAKAAAKIATNAINKGKDNLGDGNKKDNLGDGMGSRAGKALGLGQKLVGAMQTKRADAMLPAMVDPGTQEYVQKVQRRGEALRTGTADDAERASEQQIMTSMGKKMMKSGGLNLGFINQLMGQNAVQRNAARGQQIAEMLKMEGEGVSEMALRKADISTLLSARKAARGAQNEASGSDNLAASLGVPGAADMISKKKKKKAEEEEDDKTIKTD